MIVSSTGNEGPDQILPAENYVTWFRDQPVKLRIRRGGSASQIPISVPGLFKSIVEKYPNVNALASKDNFGNWQYATYAQYIQNVRTVAKAFIKLGLERFHGVAILGFNSKEWMYAKLAAVFAGGLAVGVYTTNSPDACAYCAKDSQSQIFVVEDKKQLDKILKVKADMPYLKTIIQYKGKPEVNGVLSWDELMQIGRKESDDELEERLRKIAINHCCSIIYTSGTTGPPKGVMISHDNATWIAKQSVLNLGIPMFATNVSYMPLSHVAAQIGEIYCAMQVAGTNYFADPDALKGSLGKTLKEVRPIVMLGVPRVYEKIYEKMTVIGRESGFAKKLIVRWAKSVGLKKSQLIEKRNYENPFGYRLANFLVFSKVKEALGLTKCTVAYTAGAPFSLELAQFFQSLNIPLYEGYGLSETTAMYVNNSKNQFKYSSVGKVYPGCESKIDNIESDGSGELCTRGRHVCMGYLGLKDKTMETIDAEGYLHTGDLGKFDNEDFLYITGRLKDLIITAGGENIPPILIEDDIKKNLSCLSNAVVIGDKRKFLSVLLTLRAEINDEMEPQDTLAPTCTDWLENIGCNVKTLSELRSNLPNSVKKKIQEGIDKTNNHATSNAQKIQKWAILPKDFSIVGGEYGPTMKVKRQTVVKKYMDIIDQFYV